MGDQQRHSRQVPRLCEACAYSAGMYCDACNHNRLLFEHLREELDEACRVIESFETAANQMLHDVRVTRQAMSANAQIRSDAMTETNPVMVFRVDPIVLAEEDDDG